jgi:hypothetical protein
MISSSLVNCTKRVQQFEEFSENHSLEVEKTSFLKDYFYNWVKKDVILKENANKQEIKTFDIPKKLHKWPTKPIKGAAFPLLFNENKNEKDTLEFDCETDSENEHENDEKL